MTVSIRKLAILSAVAAAVTFGAAPIFAEEPGKIEDRVSTERFAAPALVADASLDATQLTEHAVRTGKADRLAIAADRCSGEGGAIPFRCLFGDAPVATASFDRPIPGRTITVETRLGENTSILTRVPADVAAR
jgi:hypothetical protein